MVDWSVEYTQDAETFSPPGNGLVLTSSLSFADLQEPEPLADDDLMLLKCLETFDDEDL